MGGDDEAELELRQFRAFGRDQVGRIDDAAPAAGKRGETRSSRVVGLFDMAAAAPEGATLLPVLGRVMGRLPVV
ncbi:hypothetical protein ACFQ4K_22340 [Tistrella bauzanensis]